jgi:hypothetical protein
MYFAADSWSWYRRMKVDGMSVRARYIRSPISSSAHWWPPCPFRPAGTVSTPI